MIRTDMRRILQWEQEWGNKAITAAEIRQRGHSSQVKLASLSAFCSNLSYDYYFLFLKGICYWRSGWRWKRQQVLVDNVEEWHLLNLISQFGFEMFSICFFLSNIRCLPWEFTLRGSGTKLQSRGDGGMSHNRKQNIQTFRQRGQKSSLGFQSSVSNGVRSSRSLPPFSFQGS